MQEYLESLGLESLIDFKRKCDENYYNGGEDVDCIADDVYDILEEVIQKKSQPSTKSTVTVGTKAKIKQIKLPFYMGSMNKFKTDKEIMKWSNKYSLSHRIVQEEIFGPVLAVQSFRTIEEGIEKANNTPFGLSAGVWTDKGSRIFNLTTKLRAGVVWANTYNKFDPTSPFGGYKESGFGREGGLHGLSAYLKI